MTAADANPAPRAKSGWILGPVADGLVFTGPILLALGLIYHAWSNGTLHKDMPPWMFFALVVACDVAHVYATAFRVYLDPERFNKRPGLFIGVPIFCFAAGVLAYGFSAAFFWRVLAYLAVWHFVRQQWGWTAYARAKGGEGDVDRRLDQLTIYAATCFPILYWHTQPREFAWFVEGDFARLPEVLGSVGFAVHWLIMGAFTLRQVQRGALGRGINWAKVQIVATTWVAWYGGIVLLNSDIAFTALNVLSHGIPYLAVVWTVERGYVGERRAPLAGLFRPRFAVLLLSVLVLIGYTEEWMWDALVWHEHKSVFLPFLNAPLSDALLALVVPLLALPQATHYVLDGWLWKRREHRDLDLLVS